LAVSALAGCLCEQPLQPQHLSFRFKHHFINDRLERNLPRSDTLDCGQACR
jgi:hypothetical protein